MLGYIFSLFRSSFDIVKKVLIILIVYAVVVTLFLFFINKDSQNIQKTKTAPQKDVYSYINDPKLQKAPDGKIKIFFMKTISCNVSGQACTNNIADDKKNAENSLTGSIGKLFAGTIANPPASGITWTYMALSDAGFVPKTYAWQGTGYSGLMPFNPIWKLFRNISFSLLVLFVITLGFLIMFRAKLDPQAVVSIENSLPRIVVSMLMITFSFAIAGFLIDAMYVLIGLGVSVLKPYDTTHISPTSLHNAYVYADLGNIWESIFPDNVYHFGLDQGLSNVGFFLSPLIDVTRLGNAIIGIFPPFFGRVINVVLAIIAGSNIAKILGQDAGLLPFVGNMFNNVNIIAAGFGNLPSGILGPILAGLLWAVMILFGLIFGIGLFIGIFILLTMVFLMFRIFFMLLFGYIRLLMLIVFAPIILLFEAIPGQSTFDNWIRGIISELIMFPAVIMLLMIGEIIISLPTQTTSAITSNLYADQGYSSVWQPPFINGLSGDNFALLLGMGLLFLIPDLVKTLKDWIGAKPFPVQVGVATYLGGAGSVGGAAMGTLHQAGAMAHLFPGVRNLIKNVPFIGKYTESTSSPHDTGAPKPGPNPLAETAGKILDPNAETY